MTAPHEPEQTPDQDPTVAEVAGVLVTAAGALALAGLAATILAILLRRRRRVRPDAVTAAVAVAFARSSAQPRALGRPDVARAQRDLEAHYRAAYIIAAAQRLSEAADAAEAAARAALAASAPGDPKHGPDSATGEAAILQAGSDALAAALRRERAYEAAHERAKRARMEAAGEVADAAEGVGPDDDGVTWLGWYTHRDDRTTPECRAAHGSNFRTDRPPAIGWPGTLHGGACRCTPGPPHPYAQTTDEATGFTDARGTG